MGNIEQTKEIQFAVDTSFYISSRVKDIQHCADGLRLDLENAVCNKWNQPYYESEHTITTGPEVEMSRNSLHWQPFLEKAYRD